MNTFIISFYILCFCAIVYSTQVCRLCKTNFKNLRQWVISSDVLLNLHRLLTLSVVFMEPAKISLLFLMEDMSRHQEWWSPSSFKTQTMQHGYPH